MTSRMKVSPEMWDGNRIILGLRERLDDNLRNTTRKVADGVLTANTTNTPNNRGFSLRVNRRNGTPGTVAIMSITRGELFGVPTRATLTKFLPGHQAAIDAYLSLFEDLTDVEHAESVFARPSPRLVDVEGIVSGRLDQIAPCAQALAYPAP